MRDTTHLDFLLAVIRSFAGRSPKIAPEGHARSQQRPKTRRRDKLHRT